MPPHIRFLILHALIGTCVGLGLTAAIVAFDIAGIGGLVMGSGDTVVAVVLLAAGIGSTFGSLAMGTGIMMLPRDEQSWRREFRE